jgi:TolA-binding protein
LAARYQAEALWHTNLPQARTSAFHVLNTLIHDNASVADAHQAPEDLYALRDRYAVLIAQEDDTDDFHSLAEQVIKETLERFPEGKQTDATLLLLGTHYFHQGKYKEAEPVFATLAKQFPESPLVPEALLSASYCAEKQKKDKETIRSYRRQIADNYTSSQVAPLAYFLHYSYQDYLQGDRVSIKHLHNFKQRFPDSPYLINAFYLIGLDYKRDRKTHEGKWIRKKNYNDSIEAFAEAEETFNQHYTKGIIPKESLPYFVQIRYRSMLDRALVNYAVAEESEGTKRDIYLEYAIELFQQISRELEQLHHPLASIITQGKTFTPLHEECCFWLAQTQMKASNEEAAKKTFAYMLDKYKANEISDGYYLSRAYYEQGMLAMRQNDLEQAWRSLMQAEAAAKEKYLSTDQKLDLWIQQSLCYKALNQMDQAMLILSKVINNDAASGLRIKAMYMRAEIYELQGRFELARKQLEATSKKGGEWSQKAKQKLETDYGYE